MGGMGAGLPHLPGAPQLPLGVLDAKVTAASARIASAWAALAAVMDPDQPDQSVCQRGLIRAVRIAKDEALEVLLAAADAHTSEALEHTLQTALKAAGIGSARILADAGTAPTGTQANQATGQAATIATIGREAAAWSVLSNVPDPEVPAVSICDLGIVRTIQLASDGVLDVELTPTYSGCPATEVIERSVHDALNNAGLGPARTLLRRDPAWTTDWITEAGRQQMLAYGIAPPGPRHAGSSARIQIQRRAANPSIPCPRCGSELTELLSPYGSTACKSLYRCVACREPFEHFKPI